MAGFSSGLSCGSSRSSGSGARRQQKSALRPTLRWRIPFRRSSISEINLNSGASSYSSFRFRPRRRSTRSAPVQGLPRRVRMQHRFCTNSTPCCERRELISWTSPNYSYLTKPMRKAPCIAVRTHIGQASDAPSPHRRSRRKCDPKFLPAGRPNRTQTIGSVS